MLLTWSPTEITSFLKTFSDLWPTSELTRDKNPQSRLLSSWLVEMQRFPNSMVLETLEDLKKNSEDGYAPTILRVRAATAAMYHRWKQHQRDIEVAEQDAEPAMAMQEIAEDESLWREREAGPLGETYRKLRAQMRKGRFGLVAAREPGQEG